MKRIMAKREKATILYATETGKSESFAKMLQHLLSQAFDVKMFCMNEYDFSRLNKETLLFVVTSTFGNGEAPMNGEVWPSLYSLLRNIFWWKRPASKVVAILHKHGRQSRMGYHFYWIVFSLSAAFLSLFTSHSGKTNVHFITYTRPHFISYRIEKVVHSKPHFQAFLFYTVLKWLRIFVPKSSTWSLNTA